MPEQPAAIDSLSWGWIGFAVAVPPLLGLLAAWPFWRSGGAIFGNIAGTAVIFASAVALILREYVELDRSIAQCLDAGVTCFPEPSAFTRFAVYSCIGLVQIFVLFALSLRVEERIRRRSYAPEWR